MKDKYRLECEAPHSSYTPAFSLIYSFTRTKFLLKEERENNNILLMISLFFPYKKLNVVVFAGKGEYREEKRICMFSHFFDF